MALVENDIELVVYKYFSQQFALRDVQWTPPTRNVPSAEEESIIDRFVDVLNQLTDDFKNGEGFAVLLAELDIVLPKLNQISEEQFVDDGFVIFNGIAVHMLSEGIKWSHILTLFVFAFELANEYQRIREDSIETIANWLIQYTSENLLDWINEHDFVDIDDY